jgi:hypothetical protein
MASPWTKTGFSTFPIRGISRATAAPSRTGSYDTLFPVCAALACVLAVGCWVVKLPPHR